MRVALLRVAVLSVGSMMCAIFCHAQTSTFTSVPQLFYEDTTASQRVITQLAVDNAGNVVSFTVQTGLDCGFGICGAVVYSIAPDGSLNWVTPAPNYVAHAVNQIAIASDNSIFFQDQFATQEVMGLTPTGSIAPGWPVALGSDLDTANSTLLIDPIDQSVFAKGGVASAFEPPLTRTASFRQGGTTKWIADFPTGAFNTPGMILGPNGNVYTFTDRTVLLDRSDGHTICAFPVLGGDSFSPITGGDGLVFSYTATQVLRSDSGCIPFSIYNWDTNRHGFLFSYDHGILFAEDLPNNGVPGTARFIALSKDGVLLWVNDLFNPLSVPAVTNGFVYVVGIDINAVCCSQQKLFVLDENNGTIVTSQDITAICPACVKVAVGPSEVYVGDLSSTKIYKIDGIGNTVSVETPTGLSAISGEGSVYLRWDPPGTPVDHYHIFVTGNDQAEIIYTPPVLSGLAGDQQITDVLITQLPNGTLLQNGRPYQFTVTAEIGNTQSPPSTTISVIPNGFAGHLPKPPINPILFVHGWNGSGTLKGTFAQTLDFMQGTLHWQFGGQIYHLQDSLANHVDQTGSCDLSNCKDDINVDSLGDFFTSSFGNKFANYGSGDSGLSHWADEVEEFVTQLKNDSVITPGTRLVIVAHSNGGLAARDFLNLFNDAAHISDMITYGTPHQGADLFTVPGFSFGIATGGGQDAEFTCTDKTIDLSPFLAELSVQALPSDINYTAISGIISSPVSIKTGVRVVKIPARRPSDCESAEWDGLVPKSSAQFAEGPVETRRLFTNRFHTDEGSDFPAILCALNSACIQVQVLSPVDIQVIAPDGTQIARNTAEIAGASYDIINDSPQHQTTSVLIPFPNGGDYTIIPVPKPGVSPGDTFTITLSQNGSTTTVAHDVQIQNIPATGYHINVNSFPIAKAGMNQTVECSGPNNALVTLDGTRSSDPDGDPLTFEWRDENGHLVGTTSTTTTPVGLGTHAFILTVRDNRGGFDSARVRISVRDTVPPALSVSLAPSILWPPNHTLMPVMASIQAYDSCDPAPAVKLISIISNEAPLISGAGQTVPDISSADFGTDDRSFMLRAERSGEGIGRTYTITYEATDHNGNKSTKSATVFVPHNK